MLNALPGKAGFCWLQGQKPAGKYPKEQRKLPAAEQALSAKILDFKRLKTAGSLFAAYHAVETALLQHLSLAKKIELLMKRGLLLVILLALAGFLAYKFFIKKDDAEREKTAPITITATDSLTVAMAAALQSYYDMKDAFVKSDTGLVNKTAALFAGKLQAVNMEDIKADTTLVQLAEQLKTTINGEIDQLTAEPGIAVKRKTFQSVSDHLYDLLRTVRYNGSKVYQQYCPMAFENTGAAWLSNSTEIQNPYFGNKMLTCGELRDSLSVE